MTFRRACLLAGLLAWALALAPQLKAQIAIDLRDYAQVGDTFQIRYQTFDSTELFNYSDLGASPWDFSQIKHEFDFPFLAWAPEQTQFGSLFPGAEICVRERGVGQVYYQFSEEGLMLVGMVVQVEDPAIEFPLVLNSPALAYRFPIAQGTTHENLIEQIVTTSPEELRLDPSDFGVPLSPDSLRFKIRLSYSTLADGQGTALTPEGEFPVLHQRVDKQLKVEVFIRALGIWFPTVIYTLELGLREEQYWSPRQGVPVLTLEVEQGQVRRALYKTYYNSPWRTGNDVPFFWHKTGTEEETLRFEPGIPDMEWQVFLYDVMGRPMYQARFQGVHDVNVAHWPAGLYVFRAYTEPRQMVAGKFLIVR